MNSQQAEALRKALEAAKEAFGTWTATFAPEFCKDETVQQAKERLIANGTLAYIANANKLVCDALAATVDQAPQHGREPEAWKRLQALKNPYAGRQAEAHVWDMAIAEAMRTILTVDQAPTVAVPEGWNSLYIAVNHMMAKVGRDGEVDTRSPEVNAVMNALHDLDGGVVCKRAQELHEKASMPLFDATNLAVRECGVSPAQPATRVDAPAGEPSRDDVKLPTADEYLTERSARGASADWINGFTACRNVAIRALKKQDGK